MATISTYASFLGVNRDMKSSLTKVASQSTVARDTAYYKEKIGTIKSVDEFLDDYRVYSYAMKSYGLEQMTYGKAFMRKVLESDLNDGNSFANKLTDKRYLQFAEAFNFSGDTKIAQSSGQSTSITDAYKASFSKEETDIKSESAYFASQIGKVTDIDSMLNNDRLRSYILESQGLDATYTSKQYLKQVLTSDLSDPNSVASQAKNPGWKKLTEAFNFNTDGTINGSIQTASQTEDLNLDYTFHKSTFPSATLADANKRYWEKNIATVTTATELVSDSRMLAYVKTAFNLNPTMMPSSVASLMSSENFANSFGNTKLLDYFNFETDGSLANGNAAQTTEQTAGVAQLYKANFAKDQSAAVDKAIANYDKRVAGFGKLDDFFVSNKKDDDKNNDNVTEVWDVALRAFGIDPSQVNQSQLKRILSSDVNDKKSYVNSLKDERFVELNKAFNFSSDGSLKSPLRAQSDIVATNVTTDYLKQKVKLLTGQEKEAAVKKADTEVGYYKEQMKSISSVKDLLADKRLVTFVLEANGIDPKTVSGDDLKKMFASDLSDPKSFVNTQENPAFANIVASFNFDAKGNLTADAVKGVQQRGALLETTSQYARQTLEEQQGEKNDGVRLALYFERMAPTLTSAYNFLSDDALFKLFKTAYSLPDSIANMDVEKQSKLVSSRIDIKQLQDPEYVGKIVRRFTALYDLQNKTAQPPSLSILSGSGGASISPDTLLAVAQLSAR